MLQNFYESLVTIVGRCIVDVVHASLKVETILVASAETWMYYIVSGLPKRSI